MPFTLLPNISEWYLDSGHICFLDTEFTNSDLWLYNWAELFCDWTKVICIWSHHTGLDLSGDKVGLPFWGLRIKYTIMLYFTSHLKIISLLERWVPTLLYGWRLESSIDITMYVVVTKHFSIFPSNSEAFA